MIPYQLLKVVTTAAFAVMLVASFLLYRKTSERHFSIQALGFSMLVSAQAIIFFAYWLYAPEFDSRGGMLESEPRNIALVVSVWLSILGSIIAAIGYVLQYFGASRHAGGT